MDRPDGWNRERGERVPIYVYYKDGNAIGRVYRETYWHWCIYSTGRNGMAPLMRDAQAALLAAVGEVAPVAATTTDKRDRWLRGRAAYYLFRDGRCAGAIYRGVMWRWVARDESGRPIRKGGEWCEGYEDRLRDAKAKLLATLEDNDGQA